MIDFEFSALVRAKCPSFRIGVVGATVNVTKVNVALWEEMQQFTENRSAEMELEDVAKIETILQSRVAYKALGKDPSRYRLSADALLRRVIKGKGLYQVNNVVDIINFTSLKTGFSIGGYNASKIQGDRSMVDLGKEGEPYDAIGRGDLNIGFLPVLRDRIGPFGSPTSDSTRTMIDLETTEVLLTIFDFHANEYLTKALDMLISRLEQHAEGTHITLKVFPD